MSNACPRVLRVSSRTSSESFGPVSSPATKRATSSGSGASSVATVDHRGIPGEESHGICNSYTEEVTNVAHVVRDGRLTAGLTQAELAARTRIPQSSISVIEAGRRVPSVELVDRLLAPAGRHLAPLPTRVATVAESADEIRELLAAGRTGRLFRSLVQVSNNLASVDRPLRVALAVTPPALTGHPGADAFIAATVDWHLRRRRLPCPGWVDDRERAAAGEWVADGHPEHADLVRDDTPAPFRRRGVLVAAADLAVFGG